MVFGVLILKWLTEIILQVYTVSRIENCGGISIKIITPKRKKILNYSTFTNILANTIDRTKVKCNLSRT